MGNQHSGEDSEYFVERFSTRYKKMEEGMDDGRLGEIEVWENKERGDDYVCVKNLFVKNPEEMQKLKEEVERLSRLRHENLVSVLGVECLNEDRHVCGVNNQLRIFYEYFPRDLKTELAQRQDKQQHVLFSFQPSFSSPLPKCGSSWTLCCRCCTSWTSTRSR